MRRLPYRAPGADVVPLAVAEQLARERDALAAQLQRAQGELARQRRLLQIREDERANLLEAVRVLERRGSGGPDPATQQRLAALEDRVRAEAERAAGLAQELELVRAEHDAAQAALHRLRAEQAAVATERPDVARMQRLAADLANLRRRRDADVTQQVRVEQRAMLAALLQVRDSLDRAIAASSDTSNPWHQGMVGMRSQFDAALQQRGIHPVGRAGERFDPSCHEAAGTMPDPGEPDRVVQVQQQGFAFDDGELIRPALVIVSTEAAPGSTGGSEEE